jgi:nitrate reductase gamma subunit
VLIVVLFVVVPYIDLSRTEMGAEEEKKFKKKSWHSHPSQQKFT